ncbi:MAG: acylphosphatase [Gammaproteobacteria bacterium]|nr:acylphosphatase [Gammaproteobacteria bacterium]
MPCKHYLISGRVQGVFYRSSTQQTAQRLGLSGWVRNMRDGRVEAVACGSDAQLARLEAWLYQGPPMAAVDNIEITAQSEIAASEFIIRY